MSKIAEQKALEAYPKMSRISEPHGIIPADNKSHRLGDANEENREAFIKAYKQAMQDFMEKARAWFFSDLYRVLVNSKEISIDEISIRFKNYMQDE